MAGYIAENDAFGTASNMSYKDALLERDNANPQQQHHRPIPPPPLQQRKRQHAQPSNLKPKNSLGITSRKERKKKENNPENDDEDKDGIQDLKSGLIISGAVMAAIGAFFAIIKSLKEA
ncbi:hypothetical protein LIER_17538 [Lithospermum erythrorhizon]|uniref:Uncharacterized protein n=1 Tax=Lithospermum erythrorhizon TaxID=34254 RepID=A0AAV3QAS2_LITER